jgi:hypothetical protein
MNNSEALYGADSLKLGYFYGKYRGKVTNNLDPQQQGRVEINVPAVLNIPSWAMPCVPYAGLNVGFFALPPIGANVWVEFEGGNPDYPIWSGCFWGPKELPSEASSPHLKLLKTAGISLILDDTPDAGSLTMLGTNPAVTKPFSIKLTGNGMIFSLNPAAFSLNQNNIEISIGNSSVKLTAASINLNNGALEVT